MCVPSWLSYQKIGNYEKSSQFVITWINFWEDDQRKSRFSFNDNLELGLACLRITQSWGPFRESADNFLGPKNYFMFAAFAFMMKVSIILIMIQWNYELTKKNWPVCVLGTVLLFDRFWFAAFAFMMKVSIILIMIQWNYQLKRKIDRFMSYRNCYYSTGLILNLRLGPKSYRAFRETDAWLYLTL